VKQPPEFCGDGVGALELDHLADALGCPDAELLLGPAREAHLVGTVVVRVRHAEAAGGERLEHLLHGRDTGDRERTLRRAVVRDRAGDHLVLHRLAAELPVVLREFEGGLDGLAAAGGEEDLVEVARCVVGEPVRELDRRGVRVGPDREERQRLGLLGGHLGQALPTVPGRDDEQAGEPVDVALAVAVEDVVALAADHDRHLGPGLVRAVAGEVHPEVVAGLLLQGVVVDRRERVVGAQARGRFGDGHRVPQS
jgi:hypothetical protein